MKKILGLDLGVASIGWAMIERDDDNNGRIINTGVRVIPTSGDGDAFKNFQEGKPASFAAERTQKRGARRNLARWRLRRDQLLALLKKHNMYDEDLRHLPSPLAIWELRAKAAKEKISLEELGRVLLHLNQKRGFKSNRKSNTADESATEWKKQLNSLTTALHEKNQTIGQFIFSKLEANEELRLGKKKLSEQEAVKRLFNAKNMTFLRKDHQDEFERIWETQAKFHSSLDDQLKLEIGEYTVYYQRRLKSAKHLISKCRYEKHHRAISRSSPIFQYYRSLEKVVNLRATNAYGEDIPISNESRQILLNALDLKGPKIELDAKGNLTGSRIKKLLGGLGKEIDLNFDFIEGAKTKHSIYKALEKAEIDPSSWMHFDYKAKEIDQQRLYQLYHALYSIEDEMDLKRTLCERFDFDLHTADILMNVGLENDYGSLSSRAMRKLIPELEKFPENVRKAYEAVGYDMSDSETLEDRENRVLEDVLKHIPRNELRNPVVEKVLNQLISLVNEILKHPELGRPDEIRVELARELKSSAKGRKSAEERNRKNRKRNDEIRELLKSEFGIKKPSRNDLRRYKCWEEQQHYCLYSGETIPRNKLFVEAEYDLDHIIPRARMFNDSMQNVVLAKRSENEQKGNKTAEDYMCSKGKEAYEAYLVKVGKLYDRGSSKDPGGISKTKRDFLRMKQEEIPTDFIDRQLRESQYIVKEATSRLKAVCRNVTTTSGTITDLLKHQWGLDQLFQRMQVPKYRAWGMTYIEEEHEQLKGQERIKDWSKRKDHRHHALDAITIACTSQGMISQLNKLNVLFDGHHETLKNQSLRRFDQPWPNFINEVEEALEGIFVSFRNRKRLSTTRKNKIKVKGGIVEHKTINPRGALHKETVYGNRLLKEGERHKLSKKTQRTDLELIVDPRVKAYLVQHFDAHGQDATKAFGKLAKEPLLFEGKELKEVEMFTSAYTYKVALGPDFKKSDQIVDPVVRERVEAHLKRFGDNPKKAFSDLDNNPVWYVENEKPIRKVTIKQKANELEALRTKEDGSKKDFVFTRNNHHISIFQSPDGKYYDEVTSYWQAFELKKQGLPVFTELNEHGDQALLHLMINDMVLIDLPENEIDLETREGRKRFSDCLYRVQKLSKNNVMFRHHLETDINNPNAEWNCQNMGALAKRIVKIDLSILGLGKAI